MFDEAELEMMEVGVENREKEPQPRFKTVAAGATIALVDLIERGWSLTEIDEAVNRGVLTRCGGKSAYVTDRILHG